MATTITREQFDHLLDTVSYHMGVMMTQDAPYKGGFGVGVPGLPGVEKVVKCEIKPATYNGASKPVDVWDQVQIDGQWCGNRCGGRSALMAAYSEVILAAAKAVEEGA